MNSTAIFITLLALLHPTLAGLSGVGVSTGLMNSSGNHDASTASFAAIIGGIVGALVCVASAVWFSIIYRRRRSYLRDLEAAEARENTTNGVGGGSESKQDEETGFVPRYFPGTVPKAPPPYVPRSSVSSSSPASKSIPMYEPYPQPQVGAIADTVHSVGSHRQSGVSESSTGSDQERLPPPGLLPADDDGTQQVIPVFIHPDYNLTPGEKAARASQRTSMAAGSDRLSIEPELPPFPSAPAPLKGN